MVESCADAQRVFEVIVMSVWNWADWIGAPDTRFQCTLGEGDTPLIPSRRIGPQAGLDNLYFKLETTNPTGSFKDRFAASAIAHMRAAGQTRCIATSSGNTGSSLAAYCAVAGISCEIVIVEPAPVGKLKQMLAYGARLHRVRGFGLDSAITRSTFECLEEISDQPDAAMQVSSFLWSAPGMHGVQSISLELHQQLPDGVDYVFCQAGGGGLTRAVALGFQQLVERGMLDRSPRVDCVQPEGNNTMAGPLRDGDARGQEVESTTRISGLQVATVNEGHDVIAVCRSCGGSGHLVSDDQIWNVQRRLAREEGLFAEPAGATGLAGVLQAAALGRLQRDDAVVCLITGSAFKDPVSLNDVLAPQDCPLMELQDLEQRLVAAD
ncbi:MAG: pyridoxal-phosphate dependent enzyme [Planctomycetaceae bacterium]